MVALPGAVLPEEPAELECPICYQRYNQEDKRPRMLDCRHVFCSECLRHIQLCLPPSPDGHGPSSLACPLCRQPTPLHTEDAMSLSCVSPLAVRLPTAVVTQRMLLSLEPQNTRFVLLPTVSLRVEPPSSTSEALHRQQRTLVCVQLLAVSLWILFIMTCVIGVIFGPKFFHNRD